MKRYPIFVICLICNMFLWPSYSEEKLAKAVFSELIQQSEYILVGTVQKVEEFVDEKHPCPIRQIATIKIERAIKKGQDIDHIIINECGVIFSGQPTFEQGTKSLLFINKWMSNYKIVNGEYGKLDINEGSVSPIGIIGLENQVIKLNDFIEMIKKEIKP